MLSCKNWQDGDELLLKMVQYILTLTNRVIARTGFVLRGAPGTIKILQKLPKYQLKPKNKSYHLRAGPLALCHMVNSPQAITLLL